MEILFTITPYIAPVLGSIVAILLTIGAKKLLDKWGIERSEKLDGMIDRYITIGVDLAEVAAIKYAAANGAKMAGEDKKAKAIGVVLGELKQSGVTNVAEELITARIESWLLAKGDAPGEPSGESA